MTPNKILVIKFRSLGDTVLLTAPLLELRHAFPIAEIHVAVSAQWASLLDNHPVPNRIWPYVKHHSVPSRTKALARLALSLRQMHFDCVINFHASPSSATLAFATGAKQRSIHFHGHKDKNRYSTVEIPGKGMVKPIIERDMDAIRALGPSINIGAMPKIFLKDEDREDANSLLKRLNIVRPLLVISLAASRPTKAWPTERFAEIAKAWQKDMSGSVISISGPEDIARMKTFKALINGAQGIHVLDSLPLRLLAALLESASVVLANDSGPKHLAVAVGTPTVTIIGPESPFEWHPYPVDFHPYFFTENLACRRDALPGMPPWCGLETCVIEKHRCMHMIEVQPVLAQCKRLARTRN